MARIDFHDGLEPRYAGGIAINKSINADWPDEIHRAQFRSQPRKNFGVKTQQASGSVRRPGKQRDDARRNPLVMVRLGEVALKLSLRVVEQNREAAQLQTLRGHFELNGKIQFAFQPRFDDELMFSLKRIGQPAPVRL